MKYVYKPVQYDISDESYNLVGKFAKELRLRKSVFVDFLIKNYAEKFAGEVMTKLDKYEKETEEI